MSSGPKFGAEAVFDSLLLLAGVAIAVVSLEYGFGTVARPGPGLYPFFVGTAIAAFSLPLLVAQVRSRAGSAPLDRGEARTLALMIATFCFWILAMPLLGYVIVTFLATLALCKVMRLEGWRKPLAVSGGTALFVYLLFDLWLYIDLPRGILG
ncbi:MAG: tripartite tricarboxylate transporter TctB family protein [Burkholderiales bacterium]|nr:tripartite tricarboxylate transporter TctB family protein [Burkholderiales bacterium]